MWVHSQEITFSTEFSRQAESPSGHAQQEKPDPSGGMDLRTPGSRAGVANEGHAHDGSVRDEIQR